VSTILHASCVAIGGRGVLLTGASGSGKSDLALRLIDRGAMLVADDGVLVRAENGVLMAEAGPNIAGKIEIRGLGIVDLPAVERVGIALGIMLDQPVPRMPEETPSVRSIEGIELPIIALPPFEASTPVKVEKALSLYGLAP
jgi:HPr kinase/phosphorylase